MSGPTVKDVMTVAVDWVTGDMLLADAVRLLRASRATHLFVGSPEHLVGVLSEREVDAAVGADVSKEPPVHSALLNNGFTVDQVMERDGVCIEMQASLKEAGDLMLEHGVHAVPVLDGCTVVGLLKREDLEPKPKVEPQVSSAPASVIVLPYEPAMLV